METKESLPPCGEAEARSASGGGPSSHVVALARTWIGTPYVHRASVKGVGCDCLGLLRGVWRELHGGEEPESPPPYSADWAEAQGTETLRDALARHLVAIDIKDIAPGDIALFRMLARGPAKHCAIVGERGGALTLIHARQNKRVGEEVFTPAWRQKLACAFRL
ncbi:MAG: C40 family peptidase [Alphaproteobacteria bacterium]|nr:C40 family peptidase [Alphaproteobacteria bacterium]MDE2492914.1 C40 family peptidase [Alphaproteobacteria bacterium]